MYHGSGKSTLANNSEYFRGANVVATDEIRKELFGNEDNQDGNSLVFKEFYDRIEKSLSESKLTIADSTAISQNTRKELYKIAIKYNKAVRIIIMNISKETAKKRNASRDRIVPEEVIDKMYDRLQIEYHNINKEVEKLGQLEKFDISAIDIVNFREGDER